MSIQEQPNLINLNGLENNYLLIRFVFNGSTCKSIKMLMTEKKIISFASDLYFNFSSLPPLSTVPVSSTMRNSTVMVFQRILNNILKEKIFFLFLVLLLEKEYFLSVKRVTVLCII